MANILAFSGSARKDSYNQKLVKIAVQGAQKAGAEVTLINLADFDMPIFNQDLEAAKGMPKQARSFKELMIGHDGFLIASPEYNSAFTPLLKNAIDWASRKEADEPPLLAFRGKMAAIMAASPGALGGLRGLVFLRMLLGNLGVTVLANQQAVPLAAEAFDEDGGLYDKQIQTKIVGLGQELAAFLTTLNQAQ